MCDIELTWNAKRSVFKESWVTYNSLKDRWTQKSKEFCSDSRRLVSLYASTLT